MRLFLRPIRFGLCSILLFSVLAKAEVPIRGFADIGYSWKDANDVEDPSGSGNFPNYNKNNFYHGEFDLFLTKNISDKVIFLSEIVFALDESNSAGLDIERLFIQRYFSPWLNPTQL